MRAITIAAGGLLLCILLAKGALGTNGPRLAYAGIPFNHKSGNSNNGYKYTRNGYGYTNYRPYYSRNSYQYPYYNYGYQYKYGLGNKPACGRYQSCPPGYYFNTQGCVCVSRGVSPQPPPPPPPLPPTILPPVCPFLESGCPSSFQRLNAASCSCNCVAYSLLVPGRPAIPAIPGRFGDRTSGTRSTTRGRKGSKSSRRRSSRDVEYLTLGLENEIEEELRFKRRKGGSRGTSRGTSGTSSRGTTGTSRGRVFVPGRPGVPAVPPSTRTVFQCPQGTRPNEANCTCSGN